MTRRRAKARTKSALEALRVRQARFRAQKKAEGRTRITVWALREDVEGLKLAAGEGRVFSRLHETAKAELIEELRGKLAEALDEWVGDGTESESSERIRAAFNAAVEAKETLALCLSALVQALQEATDEDTAGTGGEDVSLDDLMQTVEGHAATEAEDES